MLNNKKGLISGILAVMFMLFFFAIFSVIGFYMWNTANNTIQNMDNETVNQITKNKINDFGTYFGWADKIFLFFYIVLLIGYIISSMVTPTDRPFILLIVIGILILITIVGMLLSNAWGWLFDNFFQEYTSYFNYTNFFFDNLPIITFFTALVGSLIFYVRRGGTGNVNGFE